MRVQHSVVVKTHDSQPGNLFESPASVAVQRVHAYMVDKLVTVARQCVNTVKFVRLYDGRYAAYTVWGAATEYWFPAAARSSLVNIKTLGLIYGLDYILMAKSHMYHIEYQLRLMLWRECWLCRVAGKTV